MPSKCKFPGGGREQGLFSVTIPSIPLNSNPGIFSMSRPLLFTVFIYSFYCLQWNLMLVKMKNLNSAEEDVLFTMELNYSAFQMDNGFSLCFFFFFQFICRGNSVNLIMMQRLRRKRKSVSFTSRVTAPKERTAFICTISFKSTSKFT